MSRIPTPATIAQSPVASQPLLEAVEKQLGSVPNMFRLIGNSPAGLTGYLGLNGALAKGTFPAALREELAIAVAEANGCSYCLSAHTYLGRNLAKLSDDALAAARDARSEDGKTQAALAFAAVRQTRLDTATLRATRDGKDLPLSPIGLRLLSILMRESPRVVSRRDIEREVWGDLLPDSDTLRSHLYNLRKAIDKPFEKQLLHTIHSAGYRLADLDAELANAKAG